MNVNNLAAVPSIVFGLLGLAVFWGSLACRVGATCWRDGAGTDDIANYYCDTGIFGRCQPNTRSGAGAGGLANADGRTCLPLAAPGILTGTIIGIAQAGETAPLIMIGMVAFIVDVPTDFMIPQPLCRCRFIFGLIAPNVRLRTVVFGHYGTFIVLISMNLAAVMLRRKFEEVVSGMDVATDPTAHSKLKAVMSAFLWRKAGTL